MFFNCFSGFTSKSDFLTLKCVLKFYSALPFIFEKVTILVT